MAARENNTTVIEQVSRNIWQYVILAFPLIVDAVDYFLFETLNREFLTLLRTPSSRSVWLILGLYGIYVVAIILIGLLKPDIKLKLIEVAYTEKTATGTKKSKFKSTWPEMLFFYPSMGFGIIFILIIVHTLGLTTDKSPFSDDFQYRIVRTSLGIFFIHLTGVMVKPKARYASGEKKYLIIFAPAVVVCALVINLSVAAWQHLLSDPAVVVTPAREGKLLDWFFAYPMFLFFFASPRFMFMSKSFTWYSLAGALALIGYFVWRSLDYVFIF